MATIIEKTLTKFLRNYDRIFTANDIKGILRALDEKVSTEEVMEFLDNDERVFSLEGGHYLTHSGAFTGMFFSFVPTQQELDQKVFVPGDRCVPFVDGEMLSCNLKFFYKGKLLPKKIMSADCNTARELFTFYGDEYASQYIACDPVNKDLGIANNNFDLPPKLSLTGVSLDSVFEDDELLKGDRILCRLENWDKGRIEIYPVLNHKKNLFVLNSEKLDKKQWNSDLENALLRCFDRMGPCASMEQQLAFAFFENRSKLCLPDCGSIHEFLNDAKKVSMELFGVETRLWRKGEDVPAVGNWNRDFLDAGLGACFPSFKTPDGLIDCLIKDQLYEQEDDVSKILERLLPSSVELSPEEEQFFTLQIMSRNAILRKHYNWFADSVIGSLRHKALELYSKVGELVYDIDCVGKEIEQFPQQELVTLSQLFTHISRILEMFSSGKECEGEDKTALKLSLEGMEYNFEDICGELKTAINKSHARQFKIV